MGPKRGWLRLVILGFNIRNSEELSPGWQGSQTLPSGSLKSVNLKEMGHSSRRTCPPTPGLTMFTYLLQSHDPTRKVPHLLLLPQPKPQRENMEPTPEWS